MSVIDTRIFGSSDGIAVWLPAQLGFAEGMAVQIEQYGDRITIQPTLDATAERRKVEQFVSEMLSLGPVGVIGPREPIEFPDRPGL